MKKIISCTLLLLSAHYSFAQLTINSSSYSTVFAGTLDTLNDVATSTIPLQTTGASQVWNFLDATYNGSFVTAHNSVGSGSAFTTAQYADDVTDSIGFYRIFRNATNGITAGGFLTYGLHFDKQVISMDSISSGPLDTFTILAQDVVFSRPSQNLHFSAAYSSHWADTFSAVIHATLTVPAMSFSSTPMDFRITYIQRDSVIGSGTIKLKNNRGVASDVNALMVKTFLTRTDSTFINGTFITEIQKDYTGLPNGWIGQKFNYVYYAPNEVTPIVNISYDHTYTTPQKVEILSKNFVPDGVINVDNSDDIKVFPNPVTNHAFLIHRSATDGVWDYSLIDAEGRLVENNPMSSIETIFTVQLSAVTKSGNYLLVVNKNGRQVLTQNLLVK